VDFENNLAQGGAVLLPPTLNSSPRRTRGAANNATLEYRRPLQGGRATGSSSAAAQPCDPRILHAAQSPPPRIRQPHSIAHHNSPIAFAATLERRSPELRSRPGTSHSLNPTHSDRPELKASNDEVERRGAALPSNEADLSRSSTLSLAHRNCCPAIARTDC
jgi:hypothetical protein